LTQQERCLKGIPQIRKATTISISGLKIQKHKFVSNAFLGRKELSEKSRGVVFLLIQEYSMIHFSVFSQ
jgi:hypothetical protein